MKSPSTNGSNGRRGKAPDRDDRGRFRKGNSAGKGNPLGGRVAKLRAALIQSISEKDMKAIVAGLVTSAKDGDVAAAKLVLSYVLGQPLQTDILERLEAVEALAGEG